MSIFVSFYQQLSNLACYFVCKVRIVRAHPSLHLKGVGSQRSLVFEDPLYMPVPLDLERPNLA